VFTDRMKTLTMKEKKDEEEEGESSVYRVCIQLQ
jgi:hypothetical protein